MPRVSKRKARNDIYRVGLRIENKENKRGYTLDRSKPADDKDVIIVKKGQEYYTWSHFRSSPSFSLTYPDRRQLTRSAFALAVFDLEDQRDGIEADDADSLESALDELKASVEELRDQQEENRNNMPEQLQESDSGQLLQERYDALDEAYNSLDNIDLSFDEPDDDELRQEILDEINTQDDREEEDESDEDEDEDEDDVDEEEDPVTEDQLQEKRDERLREWLNEKIEEIREVSFEG